MPRPVRFPDVPPPDLADRDLGGEPQRRHLMFPRRLVTAAVGTRRPGELNGLPDRPGAQLDTPSTLRAGFSAQLLPGRTEKLFVREPLIRSEPDRGPTQVVPGPAPQGIPALHPVDRRRWRAYDPITTHETGRSLSA